MAFSRTTRPRPSAKRRDDFCRRRLNWRIATGASKFTSPPRARRSTSPSPLSMGIAASRDFTGITGYARSDDKMSQLTLTDPRSISPHPSRHEFDEHRMSVTVVATPADMAEFLSAWEDLAASALEP